MIVAAPPRAMRSRGSVAALQAVLVAVCFDLGRVEGSGLAFCTGGGLCSKAGPHVRARQMEAVDLTPSGALLMGPSLEASSVRGDFSSASCRGRASRAGAVGVCMAAKGQGAAFVSSFDGSAKIIPRMKRPEEIRELLRVCRLTPISNAHALFLACPPPPTAWSGHCTFLPIPRL